jgi:YD repeat-containing protein
MVSTSRPVLLFVVLLLLVSACRQADPLVSVEAFTGHTCRLTSQTNFDGSTAAYQYDAAGRLTRIDRYLVNDQFVTFEYNSDSTVKARLTQRYSDSFARTREEFRYQGQRLTEAIRLTRSTATDPFRAHTRRTFSHDTVGRVTEEKWFLLDNGPERASIRSVYEYDARNLIHTKSFETHDPGAKVSYESWSSYDSYRNPSFRSRAFPDQIASFSLTNVVVSNFRDYTGTLDGCLSYPVRYRYRYNAQGYPTRWERPTCDGKQNVRAEYVCP